MIVPAVVRVERREVLLIAVDDVGDGAIVVHEAAPPVPRGLGQLKQVDVRLVAAIVRRGLAIEHHGDPPVARKAGRLRVLGVERLGTSDVHLEAQRRFVPDGRDRVDRLHRDLHHRAARGRHRRLAFDLEAELPVHDDPPLARVGMKAPRHARAGRRRDVVGVQVVVDDDRLAPARVALVLRLQVGELRVRLVGRHVLGGLDRLGSPGRLLGRPSLLRGRRQERKQCEAENGRDRLLHGASSPLQDRFTSRPPIQTRSILRVFRMSCKGSPPSRIMSARFPFSSVPKSRAIPSAAAELAVAARSASSGRRPAWTISSSSRCSK